MKLISKQDIRCLITSQEDYEKAIYILNRNNERVFQNVLAYNKDYNVLMMNLTTLTWCFYSYKFTEMTEWRVTKKISLKQLDRLFTFQRYEL
jgi:hypothetical protein